MRRLGWILLVVVAALIAAWRVNESIGDASQSVEPTARIERNVLVESPTDLAQAVVAEPVAARSEAAKPFDVASRSMPRTTDLRGTVVDTHGMPLDAVEVRIGDAPALTTDASGRFALDGAKLVEAIVARKTGWIQVNAAGVGEGRAWDPADVRIVMAQLASLHITLSDRSGRPVEGVYIGVHLSGAEPHGHGSGRRVWGSPSTLVQDAKTDARGVAVLTGIPAQQRLRVRATRRLDHGPGLSLELEGLDASGRLVSAHDAVTPLVLEPGEERTVGVELGLYVRLSGVVQASSGAPAGGAHVTLRELEPPEDRWPPLSETVSCDEDGRFVLGALFEELPTRLQLSAASSELDGGWPSRAIALCQSPQEIARLFFDVPANGELVDDVVIELETAPAITGTVVDEKSALVGDAIVRLHPLGDALAPDGSLWTGRVRYAHAIDGAFCLPVVPPGSYDLEITAPNRGTVWLRGVEAGTRDLVITAPSGAAARVEVNVTSDFELEQVILLVGRLQPRSTELDAPTLPLAATYSEPSGWPEAALGLWYGASNSTSKLGEMRFSSWPMKGTTYMANLAEGLYWIGAKARGAQFNAYRMGTGLVHIGPGTHQITLHLQPAARLRGRVKAAARDRTLHLALATMQGELVALDVREEEMQTTVPLGAQGAFDLGSVPAVPLELRLGTREELTNGRASFRQSIHLEPGENAEIEL